MAAGRTDHPLFARFYATVVTPSLVKAGMEGHRERLLAGLSGNVVEVGAGNGLNFAHYPPAVTRVLAVEPEPRLRELAQRAAVRAPVPVEVTAGRAERLGAADGVFDAAVLCLVLCSVADPATALAELRRVLRPGGELRFFEHVRAESPGMRRVQRVLDATVWPRVCGNCHTGRDSAAAIRAAGFEIERLDQFAFPPSRLPSPTAVHVVGRAVLREK